MKLNTENKALAAKAQRELAAAKKALRNLDKLSRVAAQNADKEDLKAMMNAALRFGGQINQALGVVCVAHADLSDALLENFDAEDTGGIVVMGGGGGR